MSVMTNKTDLTVANTILAQLGGNKFAAMTGVKKAFGTNCSVSFTLPKAVKNGINHVKIELSAADDYNIEFSRNTRHDFKVIERINGVYAENLQEVFTEYTGYETHL